MRAARCLKARCRRAANQCCSLFGDAHRCPRPLYQMAKNGPILWNEPPARQQKMEPTKLVGRLAADII
jgi:hypothetical protein